MTYYFYFLTLTYDRTQGLRSSWWRSTDFVNRYLGNLRRSKTRTGVHWFDGLEYLRVFEPHRDGFPHIHLVVATRRNYSTGGIYVHDGFRSVVRSRWIHGLSDVQYAKNQNASRVISYALKYLSKSTSSRHLWSRILDADPFDRRYDDGGTVLYSPYAGFHLLYPRHDQCGLYSCRLGKPRKIKLMSWSRAFPTIMRALYREDCINRGIK